jgi:hypothetical protein
VRWNISARERPNASLAAFNSCELLLDFSSINIRKSQITTFIYIYLALILL